jgi:LacI family transcriptional regulator
MPTSYDVARLAGVSQATVSRVLANRPASEATRSKVLEAAAQLGYVPNIGARAMKTGRVDTVGVVVADLTNPFYPEILTDLTTTLDAAGQKVSLWNSDGPGNEAALHAIRSGSVDGVAFTTVTEDSEPLRAALARRSPVVLINRVVDGLDCDQVSGDNLAGGALVAQYFVRHEHRSIALLGGPASASTSRDRGLGFEAALANSGILVGPAWNRRGPFSHDFGYRAMADLLTGPATPTAVFCTNDLIAFGALDAARDLGRHVPSEVWVVGFDDVSMAAWPAFDLTTVHQPSKEMAAAGVRLLLNRIADPEANPQRLTFPCSLVVRGSTGNAV